VVRASISSGHAVGFDIVGDWVIGFTAVTTGVAAVATGTLAFFTWRLAGDAGDEAEATHRLADEARTDRYLAWAPVLASEFLGHSTIGERVRVKNIGSGPALNCVFFSEQAGRLGVSAKFSLSSGEKREIECDRTLAIESIDYPAGIGTPLGGPLPKATEVVRVLICSDVLGRRWRFLEGWPPESVDPRDGTELPNWATWSP
jgi:hypothetical protein